MSSNPEPTPFNVSVRNVSPDLQTVGTHLGEQPVGDVSASHLTGMLEKLTQLDPVSLVEADPVLVIAARRGRFTAKPHLERIVLQPAGDLNAAFTELTPGEVPGWLLGAEGEAPAGLTPPPTATGTIKLPASSRKRTLALLFLLVSAAAFAVSAYFNFRPHPLFPDEEFNAITDSALLARLHSQIPGRYINADQTSELIVRESGLLVLLEHNAESGADETSDTYEVVAMKGAGPVLRTRDIGPVLIRDADTLVLNQDPHHRKR